MSRSRKIFLPIGALLVVVALAAGVMIVRASADELLQKAARMLYDTQSGHAVISFSFAAPEQDGSGVVEVWGRKDVGPNGEPAFRVNVLESSKEEALGMVAVSDGTQVTLYHPAENTAYVGTIAELKDKIREHAQASDFAGWDDFDHDPSNYEEGDHPQTPEEWVDKLLEYVTAERIGTELISGDPANHLRLVPIPEKMPDEFRANGGNFHVWLRLTDNAPLAAEYSDGAVGSAKVTASDVQLYTADQAGIDLSLFNYTPPAGATIVPLAELQPPAADPQQAAALNDLAVLKPAKLPTAARLEGTVEIRGAVVQRYRLPDGKDFTIAQGSGDAAVPPQNSRSESVAVQGVEGMLYSDDSGQRTLLTWSTGETTFWVGGDLTADQALEIANSLK